MHLLAIDAVHPTTAAGQRAEVLFTDSTRDFATVRLPGLAVEHPVRA